MLASLNRKKTSDFWPSLSKISCLCVIFLSMVSFAFSADTKKTDKTIPVEEVSISTPVYHPQMGKVDFQLGTYNYTVSWQGIPAADASISLDQQGLFYRVNAKAKTYSGIDVFYKLRYQLLGTLNSVNLMPISTKISHQENSRLRTTDIEYLDSGEIKSVRGQAGKNAQSTVFDPKNFTLEPVSAAFIARGVDWDVGKAIDIDAYNGKSRYLINLNCVDKKSIKVNDEPKEVWVISPTVKKLTEPQAKEKLRQAYIYMTTDASREILLIESEVFIGTVRTSLDSFVPLNKPGTQSVAQVKKYSFS